LDDVDPAGLAHGVGESRAIADDLPIDELRAKKAKIIYQEFIGVRLREAVNRIVILYSEGCFARE
jgi:hypothetical protein